MLAKPVGGGTVWGTSNETQASFFGEPLPKPRSFRKIQMMHGTVVIDWSCFAFHAS